MKLVNIASTLLLAGGISSCSYNFNRMSDTNETIRRLKLQYPEIDMLHLAESKLKKINAYQMYSDPNLQKEYTSQTRMLDSANRIVTEAFNNSKHEYKKSNSADNRILLSFLAAWAGPLLWCYALDRRDRKKKIQENK